MGKKTFKIEKEKKTDERKIRNMYTPLEYGQLFINGDLGKRANEC
jgi:hypothetical protein